MKPQEFPEVFFGLLIVVVSSSLAIGWAYWWLRPIFVDLSSLF